MCWWISEDVTKVLSCFGLSLLSRLVWLQRQTLTVRLSQQQATLERRLGSACVQLQHNGVSFQIHL
eukprot:5268148-Amphidinium_carterae.1